MAIQPMALQVQNPQINAVQDFQTGQANALNAKAGEMNQEAAALQQLAEAGYGVLDHNLDGPINQQRLDQMLGLMGANPLVDKIKANPELIRTITKGSLAILAAKDNQEKSALEKQKLEAELNATTAKATAPLEMSPGQQLVDPKTHQLLYTVPTAAPSPTDDQRELAQINTERKAAGQASLSMEQYLAAKGGGGLSVTTNPDGTVSVQQGGQKVTEAQGKDIGFYTRGLQANSGLTALEGELTNFWMSKADLLPLGLGNYSKTPEFRQAKVQADNFLTAILRKDTGAAISDKEFDLYGPMFLPVPGDDAGTIALKRQKRATALFAIKSGMGTAEAIAAANETALGLPSPEGEAAGGGASPATPSAPGGETVTDWTDIDWGAP